MNNRSFFPAPLDHEARADCWKAVWLALGSQPPAGTRESLELAYREPHRHYHDGRHLGECLALWTLWQGQCEHSAEVAIALWFHDSVQDPSSSGSEQRSAAWAARCLAAAGVESEVTQRINELILATRHNVQILGTDAQTVADIDLAILGSPADRFQDYEANVRKEYAWLPAFKYRRERAAVLRGFLDRHDLFHGAQAIAHLDRQARSNLSAAVQCLSV